MNSVELYNKIFNFNVAELNLEQLKELLTKQGIMYNEILNSLSLKDFEGFIYPKGYYHDKSIQSDFIVGDTYFFKCENYNGEEMVEWQCPYWAEHTDHEGKCNVRNAHITEGVTYDDMEEDRWEHCEMCPHHEEYTDRAAEAEGDALNESLMMILFLCMCEYKLSDVLFTPVSFTLADHENSVHDQEYYYCYNTENKVAVIHQTDSINPTKFIKAIEGHNRIHNAYTIWRVDHLAALQAYGLNNIPDDYKAQVCAWLYQDDDLRELFYTDYCN